MTDPMPERAESLPPIPDKTGTPRPPRAPRLDIPRRARHEVVSRHHRFEDRIALSVVTEGIVDENERRRAQDNPVLEEVVAVGSRRDKLLESLRIARNVVLLFAAAGLLFVLVTRRIGWVADHAAIVAAVLVGAFLLVFALCLPGGARRTWRVAAHVVEAGAVDKVWLYELTAIAVRESRKGTMLRLTGTFHRLSRTVTLPLEVLEGNQALWDLVYNGLRHSAANGARVDDRARELLRLPPATGRPA